MTTYEAKRQETVNELSEWFDNPNNSVQTELYDQIESIKSYLVEPKLRKSVMSKFENVNRWYSDRYVLDQLTEDSSTLSATLSANGYQIMCMADVFARRYPNNPASPAFKNCAYWLANMFREKWYNQAKEVVDYINDWLKTNSLKGGQDFKPASWFIVQLANLGFDYPQDYSTYNYPKEMGVYQEALSHWNTTDLSVVDSIVSKLCDFHIKEAHYGKEDEFLDVQFSQPDWFVFGFEILTWLSIREMRGLENPTHFSHEMMQEPLNQLPTEVSEMPNNELFDQVMKKLAEEEA